MKRFLRGNGLPVVFGLMFLFSFGAQIITGYKDCNNTITEHHGKPFTVAEYLHSGHFLEATFENWESGFLQVALFVLLTTFLYQRGSFQSKDPDKEVLTNQTSSKPVKNGGWRLPIYQNSLGITFLFLFVLFFALHFYGSLLNYNNDQILKGKSIETAIQYISNNRFWFESFQNWQSEFLSVFCVVVFTIFLRQKGSPQSKPVGAANSETGEG